MDTAYGMFVYETGIDIWRDDEIIFRLRRDDLTYAVELFLNLHRPPVEEEVEA